MVRPDWRMVQYDSSDDEGADQNEADGQPPPNANAQPAPIADAQPPAPPANANRLADINPAELLEDDYREQIFAADHEQLQHAVTHHDLAVFKLIGMFRKCMCSTILFGKTRSMFADKVSILIFNCRFL